MRGVFRCCGFGLALELGFGFGLGFGRGFGLGEQRSQLASVPELVFLPFLEPTVAQRLVVSFFGKMHPFGARLDGCSVAPAFLPPSCIR